MGRNSYDDMLPEGYREKRSGNRGTSLIIAFIGVLITLIAIVIYLMFTPHSDGNEDASSDVSAVSFDVEEPAMLANEAPALRHSSQSYSSDSAAVSQDMPGYSVSEYVVQDGDTLESIAEASGITADTIVNFNGIRDLNTIASGSSIRIPDTNGYWYTAAAGDTPDSIASSCCPDITGEELLAFNGVSSVSAGDRLFIPVPESAEWIDSAFVLPLEGGTITRRFNSIYNGEQLKGIVIAGSPGSAVTAAADGKVQDFPNDPDYGKGLVIYHEGGYVTEYYGLETIMVGTGRSVTQGEAIGSIGTSNTYFDGSPAVFFCVKQSGIALDPESVL